MFPVLAQNAVGPVFYSWPAVLRGLVKVFSLILLWVGALVFVAGCNAGKSPEEQHMRLSGKTMGTTWSVVWVGDNHHQGALEQSLSDELQRINALMSTWDPDSELSRFNASQLVTPVVLHADTLQVIDSALTVSRLTNGRYDITLDPVIRLWGFGRDEVTEIPHQQSIQDALQRTGYQQLVRIENTVRKRQPEISIDVSSLAKGFAVDQLGGVMESFGINHYLAEIGGEVRTRGIRHNGDSWRIGIEQPDGEVTAGIRLLNTHVASSGSYRNFRIENGRRLSHIIDGSTGEPINHDLVAVTVLHDNTMLADAWATALMVVGEELAVKLIDEQHLVAQLTVYRDNQFQLLRTPSFEALLME